MRHYILEFTKQSEQEFLSFSNTIQIRIKKKMEFFLTSQNPLQYAKKLMGRENHFRFRIGDYRIIVTKQHQKTLIILVIIKIGHRSKIYE